MRKRIPYGETKNRILELIQESGGMTRSEIERGVGLPREHVSAVVSRLAKPGAKDPKRIYVSHYVYDQEGAKKYPRAVYCLGDNEDAKRPKANIKQRRREWSALKLRRAKNASVFHLGMTRRELYQRGKMEQAV